MKKPLALWLDAIWKELELAPADAAPRSYPQIIDRLSRDPS